jgi:hypothetical protein
MKKIITTVLAVLLLAGVNLAAGATVLAAANAQAASQAAPNPCSVPVAFLRSSSPLTNTTFQAFYKPSCSASAVQLTSGPYKANGVVMLPGSQNVVVAETDTTTGDSTLVEINVQTFSQTVIGTTPALGSSSYLSVSPTGNAVAYLSPADAVSGMPAGVYVQKLDGSAPVRISSNDVATYGTPDGEISWSHDGNDIAYITELSAGGTDVAYAPSSGTQVQTTVTHFPSVYPRSLAWTPNDQGLLVDESNILAYVDRNTGALSEIAFPPTPPSGGFLGIDGVTVDQHWDAYVVLNAGNDSQSISAVWLGNPSTFTTITSVTGAWDDYPSVDTSGPADPVPPGFPSSTSPPTCPPLKFFGVRGSGEKASSDGGYGSTVADVKNTLGSLVPGLSPVAINYPAISVKWWNPNYAVDYEKSVETGVNNLTSKFDAFEAKCPQRDVVFGGYSQGVDVVIRTFKALSSAEQARVLVVGLGDPHFNPKQTWIDEGDFNAKLQAILVHFWGDARHSFPRSDVGHVQSWCAMGDPICNYDRTNLAVCLPLLAINSCVHLLYAQVGYTFDAAYWAYNAWKMLFQ